MSSLSGTLQFKQDLQLVVVDLSYAPSLPAVQTFASVLHTMTTADISCCAFTQRMDPQLIGPGGNIADLNLAAMFQFRNTDPAADPRFQRFRLPAPRLDILEHLEGRGYRILQSYGDTLAAAFSALRGATFEFDRGWLVG